MKGGVGVGLIYGQGNDLDFAEDGHERFSIEVVSEDMACPLGVKPVNLGWFAGNADEAKTKVARGACVPHPIPDVNDGTERVAGMEPGRLANDACMMASREWASSENAAGRCETSKPALNSLRRAELAHAHAPIRAPAHNVQALMAFSLRFPAL